MIKGLLAEAFLTLSVGLDRVTLFCSSLLQGCALGLGTRQFIEEVGRRWYTRRRRFSDVAYNESGLFGWEARIADKYYRAGDSIFVWAAGGGREMLALARQGIEVHGCDFLPSLVDVCNQGLARAGIPQRAQVCPAGAIVDNMGPVDHVILGWGGYTHVFGRDQRVALLKGSTKLLKPGGTLTLSYWTRAGMGQRFHGIARVANMFRRLLRRPLVEVGDSMLPAYGHAFTRREVEAEAEEAGLICQRLSDEPYGHAVLQRVD